MLEVDLNKAEFRLKYVMFTRSKNQQSCLRRPTAASGQTALHLSTGFLATRREISGESV